MTNRELSLKIAIAYENRDDKNITEADFLKNITISANKFEELLDESDRKKSKEESDLFWNNL